MTALLASDLDRTLIYSANAMALGDAVEDPFCVEVYEGRPISFMSSASLAALADLSRSAAFLPVTTRTVAQYSRIHLRDVRIDHAVTTNGGVILVNGEPCRDWATEVARRGAEAASYGQAFALLEPVFARPWVRKVRDAEQRFVYAVLEPGQVERGWYAEIEHAAADLGWVVSVQGRKVYVIPAGLTKEAAVAEVAARIGADVVLAAGDSLLDGGFLAAATRGIRPAHGELHDRGWRADTVTVTRASGGSAGMEIVQWFAAATVLPSS